MKTVARHEGKEGGGKVCTDKDDDVQSVSVVRIAS